MVGNLSNAQGIFFVDRENDVLPPNEQIEVICRIKDIVAWHNLGNDIQFSTEIFNKIDKCWYVTATIPSSLIKEIKSKDFVINISIPGFIMPL